MNSRALRSAAIAVLAAASAHAQAPVAIEDPYRDGLHQIAPLEPYAKPLERPGGAGHAPDASGVRTMPEYRVTDFRAEVFRRRDILTKIGMEDASFMRHPGLRFGNAFGLNDGLAYQTFLSDDWNDTMNDYRDLARAMTAGGDPAEGRMIVKAVDDQDVRLRAEEEDAASAPSIGRFQIASPDSGTRLLELPEQTIDIPFVKRTW